MSSFSTVVSVISLAVVASPSDALKLKMYGSNRLGVLVPTVGGSVTTLPPNLWQQTYANKYGNMPGSNEGPWQRPGLRPTALRSAVNAVRATSEAAAPLKPNAFATTHEGEPTASDASSTLSDSSEGSEREALINESEAQAHTRRPIAPLPRTAPLVVPASAPGRPATSSSTSIGARPSTAGLSERPSKADSRQQRPATASKSRAPAATDLSSRHLSSSSVFANLARGILAAKHDTDIDPSMMLPSDVDLNDESFYAGLSKEEIAAIKAENERLVAKAINEIGRLNTATIATAHGNAGIFARKLHANVENTRKEERVAEQKRLRELFLARQAELAKRAAARSASAAARAATKRAGQQSSTSKR